MKNTVFKAIALTTLALCVLIGFMACSHKENTPVGANNISPLPKGFREIDPTPKGEAIKKIAGIGIDRNNRVVEDTYPWKGVFLTDRKIKLSPYYIAETEVTYKLWKEVYDWAIENNYEFANAGKAGSDGVEGSANHKLPEDIDHKEHPVTKVSWQDCVIWCNAYTEKEKGVKYCVYRKGTLPGEIIRKANDAIYQNLGIHRMKTDIKIKGYRLPTETEWEWAARYQGSNSSNAVKYGSNWLTKLTIASGASVEYDKTPGQGQILTDDVAWYTGNADGKTHPVGKKIKNTFGLFDMSGNVWEWCFDRYDDSQYNDNPSVSDGFYRDENRIVNNPLGVAHGYFRTKRGSCWGSINKELSLGYRGYGDKADANEKTGFRLVITK